MSKQVQLFGRMGNKTNDIKYFKHLLPLDVKKVVEPFGGCFAVTRKIYRDNQYKKYVNDNDEILYKIYKNPDEYAKVCKILNDIAKENDLKNQKLELFNKTVSKIDIDIDFLNHWKGEKIIRGSYMKSLKNTNFTDFIESMKNINFSNDDYETVINKHRKDKNAFIFLDPPYLFSDNSQYSQQKRKEGNDVTDMIYKIYEIFNDKTTKAKIMLIINDMKIIRWFFKDFHTEEYDKIYQIAKRKDKHLIITNYNLN
jgi:site-specific DNA-adenine methylase